MASAVTRVQKHGISLHGLGVICGLTAGVWLGGAEAPPICRRGSGGADSGEVADEADKSNSAPRRRSIDSAKHWAGYGWFMSFGTILPLVVFLGSYLVHLTLVGSHPARSIDQFGIWISPLGQKPPGKLHPLGQQL